MSFFSDMRDGLLDTVGAGPGSTTAGVVATGQKIYEATAPTIEEVIAENEPTQPATSSTLPKILNSTPAKIGLPMVFIGAVAVWFLFFRKK